MTTTAVIWNSNLNVIVAGADADEQFQNIILELHTWFKAAGWTVLGSSDSVTADTSDNISVIGDIVSDTAGNAHTWIAYRSPSGFLGVGENIEVVIDCVNVSSPTISIDIFASSGALSVFTNELLRPTGPDEWGRVAVNMNPLSSFVGKKMHMGRSADGEFWFGSSLDSGVAIMEEAMWFTKTVGGDSSEFQYAFYALIGTGAAFNQGNLAASSRWHTHNPGDGAPVVAVNWRSPAQDWSNWTNGLANLSNEAGVASMDLSVNNGTQGRYVGRVRDIKVLPAQLTPGEVEDGDTDTVRRVAVDGLWFLVEASQLPILL